MAQPDLIITPFADEAPAGSVDTIPETLPAGSSPERVSWEQGFPPVTMTPLAAGGIPPRGQSFNGVLNAISEHTVFVGGGGQYKWSSEFASKNGYAIGSVVQKSNDNGFWRNTVANNSANPESVGSGWQPYDSGSTVVVMGGASITLTPLQAASPIIIISGALSANVNLVLPSYVKQWLVVNNSTGPFFVTVKTASGSGVILPALTSQLVFGDGTNIGAEGLGRLIDIKVFGATGSFPYTPTPGTRKIIVEVQAGGGSSGGTGATGAGQIAASPGASAGAYGKSQYLTSAITFPISVNVGAGAAAPAAGANAGSTGGASSFGTLLSAPGGIGSIGVSAQTPPIVLGGAPAPGAPTGGNMAGAPGQPGTPAVAINASSLFSGAGGASTYGAGGNSKASVGAGTGSSGYGGGGGGSLQTPNGGAFAGAAGGQGLVIVWEYA